MHFKKLCLYNISFSSYQAKKKANLNEKQKKLKSQMLIAAYYYIKYILNIFT